MVWLRPSTGSWPKLHEANAANSHEREMRNRSRRRRLNPVQQGQLMEQISIASIIVENRFRKDMGDIDGLAKSIDELGQIQPIIINRDRRLIAGGRRLAAMRLLGREAIAASVFDLDDLDALKVEHDENEQRKEPTVSEKVALAEVIAERLQGRQLANLKQNREGNISHSDDTGRTKDIAATKVGLGCGKTLEAAQKVVEHGAPELVEAMDRRLVSIHAARNISTLPLAEQAGINYGDQKEVRCARNKAYSREKRKSDPGKKQTPTKTAEALPEIADPVKPTPDESRLYSEGSSLSALVLAARAIVAISQISKNDCNAIAAIEDIQAALSKQLDNITAKGK